VKRNELEAKRNELETKRNELEAKRNEDDDTGSTTDGGPVD
jgi:peptidoglycan hydrolase CwlO-like protein